MEDQLWEYVLDNAHASIKQVGKICTLVYVLLNQDRIHIAD